MITDHIFARRAGGVRSRKIVWIGGLTIPFANPDAASTPTRASGGMSSSRSQSGAIMKISPTLEISSRSEYGDRAEGDDVPEHGAEPEPGPDPAEQRRVLAEALDDQHRHRREEHEPRDVADDERDAPGAEEPVAGEEAEAGGEPSRLGVLLDASAAVDERGDEHDAERERDGVQEQHVRDADHGDQPARESRPEEERGPLRGLEQRVRLGEEALVLADELGEDRSSSRRTTASRRRRSPPRVRAAAGRRGRRAHGGSG